MGTYITVLGDTWDIISYKVYGKEKHAKELVEANLNYIYTIIFPAGVVLNVPDIKIPVSGKLPPWKRGVADAGA